MHSLDKIVDPYLLVLFSVPFMRNANNQLCVSLAWGKDLIAHRTYIDNLTLAAYLSDEVPPQDAIVLDGNPQLSNVRFVLLPTPNNTLHALWLLPKTLRTLWQEIKRNAIVHSAVAGWPIPEAWMITPMLFIRRRFHLVIVESAFWRIPAGQSAGFKRVLRANCSEFLNKHCVQSADLSVFTQDAYKKSLLQAHQEKGFVIPASWIDDSNILDNQQLASLLSHKKQAATQPLKLVFAGRLMPEKGMLLLIKAACDLLDSGFNLQLDIYGEGISKADCEQLIVDRKQQPHVRMCGTVQYGADFFTTLQHYDLMVIPSLSDEQPRNVFDAFSQGLPVLCANTAGLMQCVESEKTGYFFKTGDSEQLKQKIIQILSKRQNLIDMAPACVNQAKSLTHQGMHLQRLALINKYYHAFKMLANH